MPELDLRNDVYRRPLQTALERLGLGPGWSCADIGAGGGDVTVALAAVVGHEGRVYAVDIDPSRREPSGPGRGRGRRSPGSGHNPGRRGPRPARESGPGLLPVPPDARRRPARSAEAHGVDNASRGWLLAQEPITSAGRVAGVAMSMPSARHPDIGAVLPGLVRDAGLELVDAWAEAQAGAGPGPVAEYLEDLTGVGPGPTPWSCPRWSPSWPVGQAAAERGQSLVHSGHSVV